MSRYLTRLSEIIGQAHSKKVTERKAFVEDMKEILADDEYIEVINEQSKNDLKGSTLWNQIMLVLHRIILEDASRPNPKSVRMNQAVSVWGGCRILIEKTIRLATATPDILLNCSDLMAIIFEVLGNEIYASDHETYINILERHVLHKTDCMEISIEQWKKILELSMGIYLKRPDIFRSTILKVLRMTIEYGCLQSHLLLEVKKILVFLADKVYQQIASGQEMDMKPVYELTQVACQQIATENLTAICEFSETIVPSIITLEGCPEKYNLLLLLIKIHHPRGASNSEEGAHACHWDQWKNIIRGINASIIKDMKPTKLSSCFLELACEVYRQIMTDSSHFTEGTLLLTGSQEMQPRKRRRLSSVRKPRDLLIDNDLEMTWPFIQILTVLLKKYPNVMKSDDYAEFLKSVEEFMSASLNKETTMESICELCKVLVNVEKEYLNDNGEVESIDVCWEKMWDIILRALSTNQNEILGHELLQSIIANRGAPNPNNFLRLYLSNVIRWSSSSVKTLLTFCEYTPIPDDHVTTGTGAKLESSTRISLLRWTLEIPSSKKTTHIPAIEVANLLTALCVKSWCKREFRETVKFHEYANERACEARRELEDDLFNDRERKIVIDIERCNVSLKFCDDIFHDLDDRRTMVVNNVDGNHDDEALKYLVSSLEHSVRDYSSDLESIVIRLTIVAKLLSNFVELNIQAVQEKWTLAKLFAPTLNNIASKVKNLASTRSSYLMRIIEKFEILYTTRYHCEISEMLIKFSSIDYLKFVWDILDDDDDNDDNENTENLDEKSAYVGTTKTQTKNETSEAGRINDSAMKILTNFFCIKCNDEMLNSQKRVFRNLMKIDLYVPSSNVKLRRALYILKTYGSSEHVKTCLESLEIANDFLKKLYASLYKNETAVRGILNVLPHFYKASESHHGEIEKLWKILVSINERLKIEKFGPPVYVDFVKCLCNIVRYAVPLTIHRNSLHKSRQTPTTPDFEERHISMIIRYIDNPFYIVRLEVIRAIYVVFSCENIEREWKQSYFTVLESTINNLLEIDDSSIAGEKVDEQASRISTAVQAYAAIIRAKGYLQSHALYSIIQMSVFRIRKIEILTKALGSITKNDEECQKLIESNLHYLLSRWFENDRDLDVFPWILTKSRSLEDFSRRYVETLLIIKLQRHEFKHLEILCKNIDLSFENTIENCFAPMMTLLMSMIVEDSPNNETSSTYALEIFDRMRENRGEFVKVKPFKNLLNTKLSSVIMDLLTRIYDHENYCRILKTSIFPPLLNPPNFNVQTTQRCFRYLEMTLSIKEQSLMAYLVTYRPGILEKISLNLVHNVHAFASTDKKLQAFYQYVYYNTMILRELQNSCFNRMSLFVIRDTCHTLLALAKDGNALLAETSCDYLNVFLCGTLPSRSSEISILLPYVVASLIPLIKLSRFKSAMEILRFLIIEQREILGDTIKNLDSFPNTTEFEDIKAVHVGLRYESTRTYSLEDEIEHFINAIDIKTMNCSPEGLIHVRKQLSMRKTELRMMYTKLEKLRGFTEDCESSLLHKLIYKLVRLTRSSDKDVSLEAAKCLGELGPADLTTMILHPENIYTKESIDNIEILTFRIVNALTDYLVDNSVKLRIASSNALYNIFTTPWCHGLTKHSRISELTKICKTDNPNLNDYVYPFAEEAKISIARKINIDHGNWRIFVNSRDDLWTPASCLSHADWIIHVTSKLLDCFIDFYALCLKPVCRESIEFCEILLPRLMTLAIIIDPTLVNDVCLCINHFFTRLYDTFRDNESSATITNSSTKRDLSPSHECVKCMINVVNFIRIQSADNSSFTLDYLYIAKAAQYCSAYFTSILYAELWCETLIRDTGLLQKKVPGSWISPIDEICESKPQPGKLLQDIVREAYLQIGDPDSLYGCGLSHLDDASFKTQHYTHLRQWDKVMLAHDVDITFGNISYRGILNSLRQLGLQSILQRVISTIDCGNENIDDFKYDTAWRLADWSILEDSHGINENTTEITNMQNFTMTDYHSSHYRALRCLRDNDQAGLRHNLEDARTSVVGSLRKTSLECSQTVYPILSRLQMLREIEEFATIENDNFHDFLVKWPQQNFIDTHDFQYIEPILSQRLIIYQSVERVNDNANLIDQVCVKTHLDIAEIADKQGYLPIAGRALESLSRMKDLSDIARDQLTYQQALLAWKSDNREMGRFLMRSLIGKVTLSASLRARALRVYGNWMSETKSEKPQAIIDKYYGESINSGTSIKDRSTIEVVNLTKAHADLAQYADSQYQQIMEFMKSPQYESLVECSKLQNTTSDQPMSNSSRDEIRALKLYQKQVTNDAAELDDIMREKEMYLILAARYYLTTLVSGNEHDLLVFRLVSLWLENMINANLNTLLDEKLRIVVSYKFVILLPQLAPHMTIERNLFSDKINDLIERCANEHPHHTLPVLLALKNTHRDNNFKPAEKLAPRKNDRINDEARVRAADKLINKLSNSPIRSIIREMSDLSNALVALAYLNIPDGQTKKRDISHKIPNNQPIKKIRNYSNSFVPTITIEVKPCGNYENVIGIKEYESTFELPGGVNAPKKLICIGTDGVRRKQLVKGLDDLRQDAVMQQVCNVMNFMLRKSKETNKRKLHIRTYKIVPLSQRSGILEWCENTLPISNVLCDVGATPGMHTKYYPNDWSVSRCRMEMSTIDKSPVDVKLKAFMRCCENLHPAFHHFFMEKYPSAEMWFERKLAYSRSVATTSMVGYMLGLGDRHFSNILIDQTTAEVIHIDFGIAFAQGKVLPIPETVPFRLTRDMEVAMGICGVEGVMRRSCEETVTVLRDQRKILITLLQVLLYDPLFSWAITPVKTDDQENNGARRHNGRSIDDRGAKKTNKIAERALLRIEQKLQGIEDGIASSISGQVARLIQQARDPANLCRLYCGWQAYL